MIHHWALALGSSEVSGVTVNSEIWLNDPMTYIDANRVQIALQSDQKVRPLLATFCEGGHAISQLTVTH
jgi:hypothetical protein